MKALTKYNLFIFFTTFAKALVEVFIPILLLNMGFAIKEIILFFMLCFAINIVLSPIVSYIGNKISYKWIILISAFMFCFMYYYLKVFSNIYILAVLYSMTMTFYYLGKHNYATSAIEQKKIGHGVGSILIITILAMIPASFIGSLLIKYLSTLVTALIILGLYLIGVVPLFFLKYENHHHDSVRKMIKKIPPRNFLYFALTQFKVLFLLFYPLYIYQTVQKNYSFIGILNAIVGVASIVFIYFYSKKMDKEKKDFMLFSAAFLSIVMLVEINIKNSVVLLFTSFFEGVSTKLYETSNSRDFYLLGDKYDKSCYFLVSEVLNNSVKFLVLLIAFLLPLNLYWILVIFILGIFSSGLIRFKNPNAK